MRTKKRNAYSRRSTGTIEPIPPTADQIEVAIFGPGYGECIAVHIGNNHWIVVDSYVEKDSKQPVALRYLSELGLDAEAGIRLVIASHFHDDHIRGLSKILESAPDAKIAFSQALCRREFLRFVTRHRSRPMTAVGSRVDEVEKIFDTLASPGVGGPRLANQDQLLYRLPGVESGHGCECEIWALSPSDAQVVRFLDSVGELMPAKGETKSPAPDVKPNDASVAVWIRIGDIRVLLGADLEEDGKLNFGWSAIISSLTRPTGKAVIFKIPHHGSSTAHHDGVWSELLVPHPLTALTPFTPGKPLPTTADVERVRSYAVGSFSSAALRDGPVRRRSPPVQHYLREHGITLREARSRFGAVRFRLTPAISTSFWTVELFGTACQLEYVVPRAQART